MGSENGCIAASPQDSAPALIALDATIVTNNREIPAEEFFAINVERSNILEDGEIVTELKVPVSSRSSFLKYALRKTIDFALVNCAAAETETGLRVVIGGIYPSPIRSEEAEAALSGGITVESAAKAGEAAIESARPFPKNTYKVEIAKTLIKRTLMQLV
jgi:xanthine dehydrogenase YagS FAD-binding subunit